MIECARLILCLEDDACGLRGNVHHLKFRLGVVCRNYYKAREISRIVFDVLAQNVKSVQRRIYKACDGGILA